MTVIAYSHKHRQMAIDSQRTMMSFSVITNATKAYEYGAFVFAGAGVTGDITRFMNMIEDVLAGEEPTGRPPTLEAFYKDTPEEFVDIVAFDKRTGELWAADFASNGTFTWSKINCDFAMGSGSTLALGALYVGATATKAVEAAIRYDVYSGGDIHTYEQEKRP